VPLVHRDQRSLAFEQFVEESTGSLLRTAYLVTGDASFAEDLVQESLFKVARRWARVGSMGSPRAYARKILVNLALDGSKRRSLHRGELGKESRPDGPASEVAWSAFGAVDDRLELIRALGELPARQRAALVLRFFDDLSEAEVASTLGCSVGTVKSTTSRALAKMRELVRREEASASTSFLACPAKGERP
jgi:RNA polymerase sigma-70 factor (sigma-E family)